jgi:predicted RNase H-like HicB family nuclease
MKSHRKVKATYWLEEGIWIGSAVAEPKVTAHTQARTLETVKIRMVEAIEALLDVDRSEFEMIETVQLP